MRNTASLLIVLVCLPFILVLAQAQFSDAAKREELYLHTRGQGRFKRQSGMVDNRNKTEEIYKLIFGNTVELGPNKTFELLKSLQELYKNQTDVISLSKKPSVERLANIGKVDIQKCSNESAVELLSLYNEFKYDKKNIRPYLDSVRENTVKKCTKDGVSTIHSCDFGKWQDLDEQLFEHKTSSTPIGNEKTLEHLKYLHDQYEEFVPKSSVNYRKMLNDLIQMSKSSEVNCTETGKEFLQRLMSLYAVSRVNIMPYLNYWKDAQAKQCIRL